MSTTVTIGNVTYTLTSGSYTASVTGNTLGTLTDVTIPSSITNGNETYTVTSIGNQAFKNSSNLASIVIPNTVTSIANGNPADSAFSRCSELTAVTIGANVTTIGDYAFLSCSKLTAVIIPDAVTTIGYAAFQRCSALTTVTIGESVTSIGDNAFKECTALTGVTIPDAVTSIGNNAFASCTALTAVTIGSSVTTIGEFAFATCTELTSMYFLGDYPSGINSDTFYGDNSLTLYYLDGATGWSSYDSATIGTPAQVIAAGITGVASITAFSNSNKTATFSIADNSYTNVELVVLNGSSGVTSGKAFAKSVDGTGTNWTVTSPALENGDVVKVFLQTSSGATVTQLLSYSYNSTAQYYSVDLGVGIVSIGYVAFYNCFALTAVTIPDAVTTIGNFAFYGCSALTAVTIGASVTTIGNSAFRLCIALTAATIGSSVASIGNGAFRECSELTAVIIPDAVTSIGNNAFYGCSELTAVTIGSSVTSIGYGAFAYCIALTGVTIPDAVTSIGNNAFQGCGTTLTSMYFLGNLPSSLGTNLFLGDDSLILYYLDGASNWSSTVGERPAYPIPTITSVTTSSVSISAYNGLSPVYVYTSTSGGTTWTINRVAMSSGNGTLTDLSSGTLVSTIANIYDANTYADYCKTVTTSTQIPSSNVCFPAKTPILTNCGPINIEDIDPAVHTIRNKKIVAITKTVAHDKNLVRIAKHALGHLYPEKTTLISQNHKVFFQGQMVKAKHLVDESRNVTLVPYNGQVLYNVLLEQYEKMQVNNLIVETLHPEHKVAKLYRFLQNVDAAHHGKLIALFNKKDKEQRLRF